MARVWLRSRGGRGFCSNGMGALIAGVKLKGTGRVGVKGDIKSAQALVGHQLMRSGHGSCWGKGVSTGIAGDSNRAQALLAQERWVRAYGKGKWGRRG